MNTESLIPFIDAGDIETLERYRAELESVEKSDIDGRVMLRYTERALLRAIEVARKKGNLAPRGATNKHFQGKMPTLADYGLEWHRLANFRIIGPTTLSEESFERAITQAAAEGNPGRRNIKRIAMELDVPPPSRHELLRKTKHVKPERVVGQTVDTLRGVREGLRLLQPEHYDQLDPELVREWSRDLAESRRAINALAKELTARG